MELFDVVVESSREGVRKPDPRIYQIVCQRLGVAAADCAFLDDLGINLKPARAMGMATIKVLSEEQVQRVFDARTGALIHGVQIGEGPAVASGPVPIDGTILVGTGIGTLNGNPNSSSEITARIPSSLVALCVAGKKGCPRPR